MKKILLLFSLLLSIKAYSQFESAKQIFESPKLKQIILTHKTVAILPFETKISYKKVPKDFNAQENRNQEIALAKSIQSSMYTFLLRKNQAYSVDFQDVEKTNIMLKKAGMLDKLDEFSRDEIAKILGVDAIIGGRFEQEQTKSNGTAIVTTVLFGGVGAKTGTGSLTMTINNGESGDLIWRFFKSMNDDLFSSTDVLIERMMRKVSRNFPYEKN